MHSKYFPAYILTGVAAFTAILALMGREFVIDCGFGLWTSSAWSHCTSQYLADPYSVTHVLHGILAFCILLYVRPRMPVRTRFLIATVLEAGWEILENTPLVINRYRMATAALDYTGDSILNSLGDLGFAALGFLIASRWGWKAGLLAFVVAELLLLLLIRDTLLLNILMLLHPIPAIRDWQAAV